MRADDAAPPASDPGEPGGTAACGCPLRVDGTDPYLHRDGCPRQGELQVGRWLAEYGGGR